MQKKHNNLSKILNSIKAKINNHNKKWNFWKKNLKITLIIEMIMIFFNIKNKINKVYFLKIIIKVYYKVKMLFSNASFLIITLLKKIS